MGPWDHRHTKSASDCQLLASFYKKGNFFLVEVTVTSDGHGRNEIKWKGPRWKSLWKPFSIRTSHFKGHRFHLVEQSPNLRTTLGFFLQSNLVISPSDQTYYIAARYDLCSPVLLTWIWFRISTSFLVFKQNPHLYTTLLQMTLHTVPKWSFQKTCIYLKSLFYLKYLNWSHCLPDKILIPWHWIHYVTLWSVLYPPSHHPIPNITYICHKIYFC